MGVSESLEVRFTRAMYAPLVPLVALVLALVLRLNPGDVVLVLLAFLIVLGVSVITLLGPGVSVDDRRLTVGDGVQKGRRPGGSVDLTQLTRAQSVGYRGGLVASIGPSLFRNQLLLEDAVGGRAMFGAWGWTPKSPLQTVLRRAVSDGHARMDPMTYWRLGFQNTQGAQISPLRRFI
jgi:hypothetical protein